MFRSSLSLSHCNVCASLALRAHGACVASIALGICLTACEDDSSAPIATHLPNEETRGSNAVTLASTGTNAPQLTAGISEASGGTSEPNAISNVASEAATSTTQTVVSAQALDASGDGSTSSELATSVDAGLTSTVGTCVSPIAVTCGDRVHHDTRVNGQSNQMGGYNCTARAMSGPETIYRLEGAANCNVEVRLTEVTVDLIVVALHDCETLSGQQCSRPAVATDEVARVSFTASATALDLLSVDGYAEAAGSYILEVDCDCNQGLDASVQ